MTQENSIRRYVAGVFMPLLLASQMSAAYGEEAAPRKALRVCADPFSPPTSTQERDGYENRIAELFGRELGLPVEYTWFPQRMGFIRNTLKDNNTPDGEYKCDLVMGVPSNFELAATTRPYYRSTWAMVYVKGRGLDDIKSPADLEKLPPERRAKLRIGLFDKSPAAEWVFNHGLMEQMIPYQIMSGDAREYPGRIIEEDLVQDKINLTFVWGPIAGYFARKVKDHEVVVIPMQSESDIRFDYEIAMAVRFGEKAWKEQVDGLIERNQAAIDDILREYGVPLLPLEPKKGGAENDND